MLNFKRIFLSVLSIVGLCVSSIYADSLYKILPTLWRGDRVLNALNQSTSTWKCDGVNTDFTITKDSTTCYDQFVVENSTPTDSDGGRAGVISFEGKQSGGEKSTLAKIQASHDGTSDDEKGDLIFYTNDGSDGDTPTEAMRIDSSGYVGIGTTSPVTKLHIVDPVFSAQARFAYDTNYYLDLSYKDINCVIPVASDNDLTIKTTGGSANGGDIVLTPNGGDILANGNLTVKADATNTDFEVNDSSTTVYDDMDVRGDLYVAGDYIFPSTSYRLLHIVNNKITETPSTLYTDSAGNLWAKSFRLFTNQLFIIGEMNWYWDSAGNDHMTMYMPCLGNSVRSGVFNMTATADNWSPTGTDYFSHFVLRILGSGNSALQLHCDGNFALIEAISVPAVKITTSIITTADLTVGTTLYFNTSYCYGHADDTTVTVVADSTTFTIADASWITDIDCNGFTISGASATYNGAGGYPKIFSIHGVFDIKAGNVGNYYVRIFRNGEGIEHTTAREQIETGAVVENMCCIGMIELTKGDILDIRFSGTASTDIDIEHMTFMVSQQN